MEFMMNIFNATMWLCWLYTRISLTLGASVFIDVILMVGGATVWWIEPLHSRETRCGDVNNWGMIEALFAIIKTLQRCLFFHYLHVMYIWLIGNPSVKTHWFVLDCYVLEKLTLFACVPIEEGLCIPIKQVNFFFLIHQKQIQCYFENTLCYISPLK